MANSVKVSFNETTYELVLNKVIETNTDEIRRRYTILINGEADARVLLVSTWLGQKHACYEVLTPDVKVDGEYRYLTSYKQNYDKDFPMSIVFDIIKFLNK